MATAAESDCRQTLTESASISMAGWSGWLNCTATVTLSRGSASRTRGGVVSWGKVQSSTLWAPVATVALSKASRSSLRLLLLASITPYTRN